MNKNKMIKLIYVIFIIFIMTNIFINTSVFAGGGGGTGSTTSGATTTSKPIPPFIATACKAVIAFTQVLVTGCFTIRFTMLGIQYFTAVGANVKAATKQKMGWTLLIGVLTFLAIFIFGKIIDQL